MDKYKIMFNFVAKGPWMIWEREGTDMESCLTETKKEISKMFGGHNSIVIFPI